MHTRSKKGADVAISNWRLDAAERTAVLASFDGGCPALVYFGAALPKAENLDTLARMSLPSIGGGQLDPVVPLTLLPTSMDGWLGNPGVKLPGNPAPKGTLVDAVEDQSAISFEIDAGTRIGLGLLLCPISGVLKVSVTPTKDDCVWLAASIPVPDYLTRIIDHGGRWCGEFQRQERPFVAGRHIRESHEGRAGHANFPGVIFAASNCDENSGECLAVAMAWSGGHRMVAEETPDGRRQVQFGFADGMTTATREVWIASSSSGFNGASQAMQAHIRSTGALGQNKINRPVHYNCWEAVYFRHSVDELKDIATRAADLGAERFVLDDGWFKDRNDDTTSLGDWTVDKKKYPDGLQPLVDHVISLGMEFGIWFEPEMINTDSDLYRAHPDWVLGPQDQPSGRGQFVLDLSKPEVCDYLFDAIAEILRSHPIAYVKWDHNRALTGGLPQQTEALYALLNRLNEAFPDVDIESCASGGGRVDYGILKHTTRVWLSDSNDAHERLRMQQEASRWLPPEVQGSHIGPRVCHTSGRVLPIAFRAAVAAQRHMGFEMDPRELTDAEADTVKRYTAWYKANRDFMFSAQHYRLDANDDEIVTEMFVGTDQSQFIVFIGQLGATKQISPRPLRLAGLSEGKRYGFKPFDTDCLPKKENRNPAFADFAAPQTMSGRALMTSGFRRPFLFPDSMLIYEGVVRGAEA